MSCARRPSGGYEKNDYLGRWSCDLCDAFEVIVSEKNSKVLLCHLLNVKTISTDSGFVTIPIYSSPMRSVSPFTNKQTKKRQICKVLAHEPSLELNFVL